MSGRFDYNVGEPEHQQLAKIINAVAVLNPDIEQFYVSSAGELCTHNGDEFVPCETEYLAVALRSFITPYAEKVDKKTGITELIDRPEISSRLAKAYLTGKSWVGVPRVVTVQSAPYMGPDYRPVWLPGFHEDTGVWVTPGITKVTENVPSVGEILGLFETFSFLYESDVADALAFALTSFMMQVIREPVPMWMIAANREGSGKTQLAEIVSLLGGGEVQEPLSWTDEREREKMLASMWRTGGPTGPLFWDNVKSRVDSAILESILTSRRFKARVIGTNVIVRGQVDVPLFMALNAPTVSKDMKRRGVFTVLDKDANPKVWDWGLKRRVLDQQARFVNGIIAMIERWRDAGTPEWTVRSMSNFEEWSRIIGGILEVNGVTGFLETQDRVATASVSDDEEDEATIVRAIATLMWGRERWSPMDLFGEIRLGSFGATPGHSIPTPSTTTARAFLEDWLRLPSSADERGGATWVGRRLSKLRDREYDTHIGYMKLVKVGRDYEVWMRRTKDSVANRGFLPAGS